MRKLILVILILITSFLNCQSQIYKGIGVKTGVSISNEIASLDPEIYKYKFGFTAGIFKEIPVYKNLSISAGINYARKGTLLESIETNEYGTVIGSFYQHINIDYITAEITGKYFVKNGCLRPYLMGGGRLDFFVSKDEFIRFHGKDIRFDTETFTPTHLRLFGATLGLGAEYSIGKAGSVFLEGTYNPDITKLIDEGESLRGTAFEIKTGFKF